MSALEDPGALRPLSNRVILIDTKIEEAPPTALVRIDGGRPRPLLVGQVVAERGVLEQITSGAIAIRDGALVYVIVTTPTVAAGSPDSAKAREAGMDASPPE